MLVSLRYKVFFIHNPRCAGSAITEALTAVGDWRFLRPWVIDKNIEVNQHNVHVPRRFQDYFRFCVCRNPYARFVSEWSFRTQKEGLQASFRDYLYSARPKQGYFGLQTKYTKRCHKVFRFEEVTKSGYIELPFGRVEFEPLNGTSHNSIKSYFSGELEKVLWQKYRDDFDWHGYQRYDFGTGGG